MQVKTVNKKEGNKEKRGYRNKRRGRTREKDTKGK